MKYGEYNKYFEDAARSNKQLKHLFTPERKTFRRMDIEEALTAQKVDLDDISMILEPLEIRGRDLLSDNPRKMIRGAFYIVKPCPKNDFDKLAEVMEETELVG